MSKTAAISPADEFEGVLKKELALWKKAKGDSSEAGLPAAHSIISKLILAMQKLGDLSSKEYEKLEARITKMENKPYKEVATLDNMMLVIRPLLSLYVPEAPQEMQFSAYEIKGLISELPDRVKDKAREAWATHETSPGHFAADVFKAMLGTRTILDALSIAENARRGDTEKVSALSSSMGSDGNAWDGLCGKDERLKSAMGVDALTSFKHQVKILPSLIMLGKEHDFPFEIREPLA